MANNRNELNKNLAQMLKGGVIMDVTTPEQAQHRRGRRRMRRYGARAHSRRYPRGRRRFPHERPGHDQGHPGGRVHPRHGESAASAILPKPRSSQAIEIDYIDESEVLCARRRHLPHRQEPVFDVPFVCGATRPGRGAAPHRRGRDHDPHQGRAGHGRRRPGRAPHAQDEQRRSAIWSPCATTSCSKRRSSWHVPV